MTLAGVLGPGGLRKRIRDLIENPQLKARGFWVEIIHPEWETTATYPGSFCKISGLHSHLPRRSPLIGEHNEEIYQGELGLSQEEMLVLKQSGVI